MLIAGYCRVSTDRQMSHGHALERYKDALTAYGIPQELIFWDVESGASEKREGFNKILALVQSGAIKKVVVPNFDRLTRSPRQWEELRKILVDNGCAIEFLEDGMLDLESPDGLFSGRIKAALAAQVRDRVRKHSLDGHKRHREKCVPYHPVFGFKKVNNQIIINNDIYIDKVRFSGIARELVTTYLRVSNLTATVREVKGKYDLDKEVTRHGGTYLKIPGTSSSLKGWLQNPQLIGGVRYLSRKVNEKTYTVYGLHQPLIDEATFELIQKTLQANASRKHGVSPENLINPLSGICYCYKCGGKMSGFASWIKHDPTRRRYYLKCKNAASSTGRCDQTKSYGLTIEDAEQILIEYLCSQAQWVAEKLYVDKQQQPDLIAIELQKQIVQLESLKDDDLIEVINKKRSQLRERELKAHAIVTDGGMGKLEEYFSDAEFWLQLEVSAYKRNSIYREIVERIVIAHGKIVEIQLRA